MALQRDFETLKEKNDSEKQPVCTNPLSILKVVMKQCKNMQERMLSQLAAAESRHRKVGSPIDRKSGKNASCPVSHQCSRESERGGDFIGIQRSSSVTEGPGCMKEYRLSHRFRSGIGPDIAEEDIPSWYCHSRTLGAFFFP